MSEQVDALIAKALGSLMPEERDELLRSLLVARLGTPAEGAGLLRVNDATGFGADRDRLASLLAGDPTAPHTGGLKMLPIRLPAGEHERLRDFCQANGYSMAVVIVP